jgi:hypothetical protein
MGVPGQKRLDEFVMSTADGHAIRRVERRATLPDAHDVVNLDGAIAVPLADEVADATVTPEHESPNLLPARGGSDAAVRVVRVTSPIPGVLADGAAGDVQGRMCP